MPDHEIWLPIPGFQGYEASSHGRIRSVWRETPRVIVGYKHPDGYRITQFKYGTTLTFHALVALAFLGPCPPGLEVCHNNGNPTDNRPRNLRYDTHKNNLADRSKHGRTVMGERHHLAKLTSEDVKEILALSASGVSKRALAARFNVTRGSISHIKAGRNWKHITKFP